MNTVDYLVLNGGEAVGKGTQKEKLLALYPKAVSVREPGGTPEAEIIREVLLEKDATMDMRLAQLEQVLMCDTLESLTRAYIQEAMKEMKRAGLTGTAEMYLYAASRAESNQKKVRQALEQKQMVLGDRSVACSMAYQGYARGLDMDQVWALNQPTLEGAMPQLEIFLYLPPEEAKKRLQNRTEKQDRLDLESDSFHERVQKGYMTYYERYCPYPYVILDASGTIEEVHAKIQDTITHFQQTTR